MKKFNKNFETKIMDILNLINLEIDSNEYELLSKVGNNPVIKHNNKIYKYFSNETNLNKENRILFDLGRFAEINKNILIMDKIDGNDFRNAKISQDEIIVIIEKLKVIWNIENENSEFDIKLDFKNRIFNLVKESEIYFDLEKYIKAWEEFEFDDYVNSHGDVNPGNVIKTNSSIELIDFEFSKKAPKIWDIASFIYEFDLKFNEIELISKELSFNLNDLILNTLIFSIRSCFDFLIKYKYSGILEEYETHVTKLQKIQEYLLLLTI